MLRRSFLFLIIVVIFSGYGVCVAATFQGLGYLTGGSCSEATAVSADGSVVVGTSCTASGVQAFRWTDGTGIVGIPIPEGLTESWATDVSADANFVLGHGRISDSPPYNYEGFRWHISGQLDRIKSTGVNITAQGISGDGLIVVGTSWGTGIIEEAFRWTAEAGLYRLDGLNGEGVRSSAEAVSANGLIVVGHRIYEGLPYGDCFRWTESEVIGFDAHTANATSSDGSVIVGGLDNHDTALFEAYRWTQETGLTLLGTCLPNYHSRALAVSGDGSVVVGYVQNNSGFDEQKAFIWDQKHGMRLLQDVLEDDFGLDLSGWKLTEPWASWKATGISEDGLTVVGVALNPQGQREAWRAVLVLGEAIYVDADAAGANNGSSWENAYNCLQDALADANSSAKAVEIRVAEGVYKPDHGAAQTPGDMEATFRLINGVKVRGGYAGVGEPTPDARDMNEYETILSGDLSGNDVVVSNAADLLNEPSRADNSYHVVTGQETDETAVLDGFTITGGNANRGYWVAYYGGGITADSAGLQLVNCRIEGNVAAQGGGLQIGSGGAKLSGCTFSGNAAIHAGGMINGGLQTTVADCEFIDNYADTSGGATICTYATFTRCSFVRNRAGLSTGGAVGNDCSAPKFEHCTFIENSAPFAGGAISNFEGDLVIIGCRFVGNSSENGGAIYQGDTDTILTGCEFTGNEAVTGGGVSNDGYSDPTLTDCSFVDNRAQFGGGFHNTTGSAPTMVNCSFTGNSATDSGGAIGSYNNYGYGMVLNNCIFSDNTAPNGGAIYNDQGDPILTGCTFEKNSAGYEGGGLFNLTGSPVLTGCLFTENWSETDGGGMQNDDGSPILTECMFISNYAEDEGGGMCNEDDKVPPLNPKLANCIFIGNTARGDGGGMCNDRSSPEIVNCTFSENSADRGGGIYNENDSVVVLKNCILFSDSPDEIYDNDAAATATYSNIQGGWAGLDNIDADPCFIDAADGDLRLSSDSPCIDAGDNSAPNLPTTDLDGHPRIIDGDCNNTEVVDMGAYEFNYAYIGDFDYNCEVDFADFSIFAIAWMTQEGDPYWDWVCDISEPGDNYIDWRDVAIICDNWLAGK